MAEGGGQDSVGCAVCLDVGRAATDPSRRLPGESRLGIPRAQGRLTLANATFLLLYTAWLQWTPRIVDHCRTLVECVLLRERILLLECVLYRHGYNGLRV